MPEEASDNIRHHILSQEQPARPARFRRIGWMKVAAVVLPLAGIAVWMFMSRQTAKGFEEYVNNTRSVQTFRLADGSEVSLNRGSRLTVRKDGGREAWLEGEAFFTIQGIPHGRS